MRLGYLSALMPIAAMTLAMPVEAKPSAPTSRYLKVSQCKEIASGDVDKGEDWIYIRCEGLSGIPMWYACMDSARCRHGFGRKENLSSGMFGVHGKPNWPIEWRGRMVGRQFRPFAVIMRAQMAGMEPEEGSSLSVFRLRPDGMSCLVGDGIKSNEAARKIADAAEGRFTCIAEPKTDMLTGSPIW